MSRSGRRHMSRPKKKDNDLPCPEVAKDRVAERLVDSEESFRRRRPRRFHPMMIDELIHMAGEPGDPVAILMAASVIRDDAPWLVYRAVKSGQQYRGRWPGLNTSQSSAC